MAACREGVMAAKRASVVVEGVVNTSRNLTELKSKVCTVVERVVNLSISDKKLRPLIFAENIVSEGRVCNCQIDTAGQVFIKKEMHGVRVEILIERISAGAAECHFIAVVHLETRQAEQIIA